MKAFIGILLIGLFTAAYGDTAKTEKAKRAKLTRSELQVMGHYRDVNRLEIDLGKLAASRGGTQAVKSYGEMLVEEHTDSDKKLAALAKETGQTIPQEKMKTEAEKAEKAAQKKHVAALKQLQGADFDREYLRMMVEGHDKELATIDQRMAEVHNAQLLDLLSATKPMLQHHADEARALQKNGPQAMRGPGKQ